MKRLEDIPKKNLFEVPDGYFEKLPLRIQERVSSPTPAFAWFSFSVLKYALPVVVIAVAGVIWLAQSPSLTIEEQLGAIQEEQLVAYLNDSDLTTEELTEAVTFSKEDIENLEGEVYKAFDSTEGTLEEIATEMNVEL